MPIALLTTQARAQQKNNSVAKPLPYNVDSGNLNTQGYQLFGFNDPELDMLNADYRRLRKIVDDYYHSDRYLLLQGQVRGYNHPVVQTYDNDTLRDLMLAFYRTADSIKMAYETPDNARRSEIGKNVGAYFSSEDFKKLNARLQKKYDINPDLKYDEKNPAYKQYQTALKKSTPVGIQQQLDELVSLSREAQTKADSPQYMANYNHFKALGDSLKEYYKKPHLRQYADTMKIQLNSEEIRKYRVELDAYNNNPEIKHDEELMRADMKKIGDRMQTADFRQHVQEWKNQLHTVLNKKYDNILHADKKDE